MAWRPSSAALVVPLVFLRVVYLGVVACAQTHSAYRRRRRGGAATRRGGARWGVVGEGLRRGGPRRGKARRDGRGMRGRRRLGDAAYGDAPGGGQRGARRGGAGGEGAARASGGRCPFTGKGRWPPGGYPLAGFVDVGHVADVRCPVRRPQWRSDQGALGSRTGLGVGATGGGRRGWDGVGVGRPVAVQTVFKSWSGWWVVDGVEVGAGGGRLRAWSRQLLGRRGRRAAAALGQAGSHA